MKYVRVSLVIQTIQPLQNDQTSYRKSSLKSAPPSICQVIIFPSRGPVVWRQKKRQRLIEHFFSDHPRRIQLQHCLEISEITVYLRKNNQSLSDSQLQSETRPCNELSYFLPFSPSLFLPLSPYLHLSLFLPLSLCLSHSLSSYSILFTLLLSLLLSSLSPTNTPPTSSLLPQPSIGLIPHGIPSGDYCGRPEGGAHAQTA